MWEGSLRSEDLTMMVKVMMAAVFGMIPERIVLVLRC